MAVNNFENSLKFTLKYEGGWSNDPRDAGGCTMKGVILSTYRSFHHDQTLSCDDLKNISDEDVAAIYQSMYWNVVHADQLPLGVDFMVFDMYVNAGRHSNIILQTCVGTDVDGAIGPMTLAAVGKFDPKSLINLLADGQQAYYKSLKNPTFEKGWLNRVAARRSTALDMIQNAINTPVQTANTDAPTSVWGNITNFTKMFRKS